LWWSISNGAVVSHSCGQPNALVFGANLQERAAITKPLAMSTTPTSPVVLHEGFDVSSDATRLVSEGYVNIIFEFS